MKNPGRIFRMKSKTDIIKNRICKGKPYAPVILALMLIIAVILFPGCSGNTYTQAIKITAEPVNVTGRVVKIEYYRDSELVSSIHFIDGNGDSIIDGKSGPSGEGHWPKGWEWFDNLYSDVIVGHATIEVTGEKVKIQDSNTYEFLRGEYECAGVG